MSLASRDELSEAQLRSPQERVLSGYIARFELDELQVERLHIFFSPSRIPKGLTATEVDVVLALFPLRAVSHKSRHFLPKELYFSRKPMTRKRFDKGIMKFLRLASAKQIGSLSSSRIQTKWK